MANANALRFGREHPKMQHLVKGVVSGIGGYGNCVGVPTVAGETNFHAAYDGNILVNAMTGVADTDKIFYSAATGVGNPIVYVGSKTGRDGITVQPWPAPISKKTRTPSVPPCRWAIRSPRSC